MPDRKVSQQILVNEREWVEKPLLNQLEGLGWTILDLEMKGQTPAQSFRESFDEVVILPELRKALRKINDWIDEDQIDEAISTITRFQSNDLLNNNEQVLQLLREGTSVSSNRRTGDKSPTVGYIDFKHPERNSFLAIAQFKLRVIGTDRHIYPDIILFLNGLPVGVIECKSPKVNEPIAEAIDQLLRYSEQRGEKGEGNKELFYYNQFLVGTCRDKAKISTITAPNEKFFFNWLDPYPLTIEDLEHGQSSPSNQHRLVAGVFAPENLLSLIRTFTIFSTNDKGETIKILARYQQFRAIKKAVNRLLSGETKDKRSGLVWHTQGSGKSLTMMFMVREMYIYPELMSWKVIYVTDRTNLEKQLKETAQRVGLEFKVAASIARLRELLPTNTSEVVMAMIHKFQESELGLPLPRNPSDKILVMTDEAHRSQFKTLGAQFDAALPNATLIGYTGTPTDKTEKRFGEYIDTYTMKEAVDDEVTVKIVYEGRTEKAEIDDKEAANKKFRDVFEEYTEAEKLQILSSSASRAYLESEPVISEKARDMIDHYVSQVFPNGFKAQVVATSRDAAVFYKTALETAITEKIARLKASNPDNINLEKLGKLKTAVVMSFKHNQPESHREFTDEKAQDKSIASFKLPFDGVDERGNTGDVGILVVANMLLTGFDAPIEQVMYLDQVIRMHNLLQAIARVNRVYSVEKKQDSDSEKREIVEKKYGFIVDYVGVGHHLRKALADYNERDQDKLTEALIPKDELIGQLKAAQRKVEQIIEKSGIVECYDYEAFYDLFYDEDMRFEFVLAFREFAKHLDALYPNKEALEYIKDFKYYSEINVKAEQHFRDQRISLKGITPKLRKVVDEHLISKGIDQKIKPISILDEDFIRSISQFSRDKTKASAIEHAVRHFIEVNVNEDPTLYNSFSEQLEQILIAFQENWNEAYKKLEELRKNIIKARTEDTHGLHRTKQIPFFNNYKAQFFGDAKLTDEQIALLVDLTQDVTALLETELKLKGFWERIPAQNRVKANLLDLILSPEYKDKLPDAFNKRQVFISSTMQIAKLKNETLLYV
jgi:type I restriction enzyme R subunit